MSTPPFTWTFYLQILLGIWLIASPDTFDYQSPVLWWSDTLTGILLLPLAWLGRRQPLWNLPILALGIWLEIAPLLFWAPTGAAYLNNTLVGALIITLSFILPPTPGQLPDTGGEIPPGWSYNPSSWPQRLPIALLALLCWMISRYLAAYQLGYIDHVVDPFFDQGTEEVLTSNVSKAFPVSDAGLGALAYTFEFLTTLQGGTRRWRTSPWMVLIFGILVIPVSFTSILLILLQPLVVGHWCTLCLVTAALMLLGIPLAIDEVLLVYQYLKPVRGGAFWRRFFLGGPPLVGAKEDPAPIPLDAPLFSLLKAGLLGVGAPLTLLLTLPVGISLMGLMHKVGVEGWLFDLDLIVGAFAMVVAVISLAEPLRPCRRLNLWLGAGLFLATIFTLWLEEQDGIERLSGTAFTLQILFSLLLGLFSLPRGEIQQQFALPPSRHLPNSQ